MGQISEHLATGVTAGMLGLIMELGGALLWTAFHIAESTVKLFLPDKLFHKDISGQVLLITGGGSGIGRLMSLRFARLGATVVTWDINTAGNKETVEMIKKEGHRAFAFTVDMSNKEAIYDAARQTKEEVGPVTILVNNAGIVSGSTILETPDSKIIKTFEVNVLAHFWTIKAFLPDMIKNRSGHVVNIASLAGHAGTNKLVDYCSSKFAAVGLDEAFRVEMAVQGHDYISTGMFAGVYSKIIPILEPEFVADSAVAGVLANREVVLLPWWSMFLLILKNLVPSPAFMKLATAFGFNCSMDQFTGREKTA